MAKQGVTFGTVCLGLLVAMVSPGNDLHFGTVWLGLLDITMLSPGNLHLFEGHVKSSTSTSIEEPNTVHLCTWLMVKVSCVELTGG